MILFAIFLVVIFVNFFKKEKKILNTGQTRIVQLIHLLTVILVIVIICMKQYDMSFRGYITEKMIYWLFYFSALVLLVFGNPKVVKGIQRIYYFIYLFVPILLVFTLAVPFLGLALIFFLHTEFFGDTDAVKYSDKNFRLEMPFTGILGRADYPVLIVKKGMVEYEDQLLRDIPYDSQAKYRISKQSDNVILVHITAESFPERKPLTKTIRVYLKHPLN